jgi:PRTRC genetic system protein E
MGFEAFDKMLPEGKGATLQLILSRVSKDRVSIISFYKDGENTPAKPLMLTGTFEELNKGYFPALNDYKAVISGFTNNIAAIEADLKKQEGEKKSKLSKSDKQRLTDLSDEETVLALTAVPASDGAFKTALKKASMMSMIEALRDLAGHKNSKTAFKAIEAELKTLTDKSAKDYGIKFMDAEGGEPAEPTSEEDTEGDE